MTTLHLDRGDFAGLAAGANGSVMIELTEVGERRIIEEAGRRAAFLEAQDERRRVWLRSLSNEELMRLATSRFGGPEPDVAEEGARRIRAVLERIGPAMAALRSAGLVSGR